MQTVQYSVTQMTTPLFFCVSVRVLKHHRKVLLLAGRCVIINVGPGCASDEPRQKNFSHAAKCSSICNMRCITTEYSAEFHLQVGCGQEIWALRCF